jgi:hypothetical protein
MKKIITSILVVGAAAIVFVSTKTTNQTSGVSLKNLITVNTANAECSSSGSVNFGFCLPTVQECVFGGNDCNP